MNLLKRTYGGAIILLVIFAITYFGHLSLSIGFTVFSLIAIREITEAFDNIDIKLPKTLLYICDFIIMGAAYWQDKDAFILAIIFSVIALLIYMIFKEDISFYTISIGIFILMYIPTLMGTIIRIRDINYIWPLYITAWGSDTFAYLIGSTIGRSKIKSIAHISPKKTIEGCVGGILGALVLNLIYHKYNLLGIPPHFQFPRKILYQPLACAICRIAWEGAVTNEVRINETVQQGRIIAFLTL